VDGSVCSCQKFLHDEGKCPKVRGMEGESYCVQNRCQKTPGTNSPTPAWKPASPTVKTKPPTEPPTDATEPPTPHGPIVNCGDSTITDATCHTLKKAKAPPSTKCTDCLEAECCIEQTCAVGLAAWCSSQDTGTSIDCGSEDPCQVLKEPVGSHFPVNGAVKCWNCDLDECCTNKTCLTSFPGACPTGQVKRQPSDDGGIGCNVCDATECCKVEVFTCTKSNFPMNCSVGSHWEESNVCQTSACTPAECCVLETRKCTEAFPMSTACPKGMRHKNASKEDEMCKMCGWEECCLKEEVVVSPTPRSDTAVVGGDSSGGNGGTIAAVVIVIVVLLGAAGGFFLWKRHQMQGKKEQYIGLNDDSHAYQPPTTA